MIIFNNAEDFYWTSAEKIVLPIALLCVIALAVLICFLTRKKSETIKKIPLMIIAAIMLILEVVKQILAIKNGYDYWTIPLHFCSLFLYFYPLASFFKGKISDFGKVLSLACGLYFISLFYFNPSSVIGNSSAHIFASFGTFHTFLYHHLIILFTLILIGSNIYHPKKIHFLYASIGILTYAAVAITAAHFLETNYCFLLRSGISFMENIRTVCGQTFYTFVMIFIGLFGVNLVVALSLLVEKIINKIKYKSQNDNFDKMLKILKSDL